MINNETSIQKLLRRGYISCFTPAKIEVCTYLNENNIDYNYTEMYKNCWEIELKNRKRGYLG